MNNNRIEDRRPLSSLAPSLLFTEEEVKLVDWEKVFEEWNITDASTPN